MAHPHHHGADHAGHAHAPHTHAGHHHGPGGHGHLPASFGRAFALGIGLNLAFVLAEAGFGLAANSAALLADAGHNLSDVLGLLVAWGATLLARRPPSLRYTQGPKGAGILAALFNALAVLAAAGAIACEAALRLVHPAPVAGGTVMAVAAAGIVVNGATAWLFASGQRDLNIRGAYLHMLADAAVSAGVVVAGLAIALTGQTWLDPLTSLVIVAVIAWGTWDLLRDSVRLALGAVPSGIDLEAVRALLAAQPGVAGLHRLHVWPVGTAEAALSAHLVMPGGHPGDLFLVRAAEALRHHGIGHVTLQIETGPANPCAAEPARTI